MLKVIVENKILHYDGHQGSCEEQPQTILQTKVKLKFVCIRMSLYLGELMEKMSQDELVEKNDQKNHRHY